MKITPIPAILAFACLANGQATDPSQPANEPSISADSVVKIVGDLPNDSAVIPKPSVPKIYYQDTDVLEIQTRSAGQRQITIQKVSPLVLPQVGRAPTVDQSGESLNQNRVAAIPHKLVMLGGTVFIPADNPNEALTYLRSWKDAGSEPVGVWLKADARILSGFATYGNESGTWDLILVLSEIKVESSAEIRKHLGTDYGETEMSIPDSAQFNEKGISFVGGDPGEEHSVPINALMDLYRTDKDRLRAAYVTRIAAAEEQERLRAADPPEKKNMIIRYWRLDAAGQEGLNPKPADIR